MLPMIMQKLFYYQYLRFEKAYNLVTRQITARQIAKYPPPNSRDLTKPFKNFLNFYFGLKI